MQNFEPPKNSPHSRMYEFIRVPPTLPSGWWTNGQTDLSSSQSEIEISNISFFRCYCFYSNFQRTTAENLIRRHLGYVASDLDLHCLPMFQKMVARHKMS